VHKEIAMFNDIVVLGTASEETQSSTVGQSLDNFSGNCTSAGTFHSPPY
jgi:hypothetical protein